MLGFVLVIAGRKTNFDLHRRSGDGPVGRQTRPW